MHDSNMDDSNMDDSNMIEGINQPYHISEVDSFFRSTTKIEDTKKTVSVKNPTQEKKKKSNQQGMKGVLKKNIFGIKQERKK